MKVKKIILYVIFYSILLYSLYELTLFVLAFGHQKNPEVQPQKELKNLAEKLTVETNGGDVHFNPISQVEINNCGYNLELIIYTKNDSIAKTNESMDNYIKYIKNRINKNLKNRKCIDSLIVTVSAPKAKFSQSKHFRYSFPIK